MHSPDIRKSVPHFQAELDAMRKQGNYDFTAFVFPPETQFGQMFSVPTSFARSKFRGVAGFRGARFLGDVNFDDAIFESDADFTDAYFGASASFVETSFGPVDLIEQSLYQPKTVALFTGAKFAMAERANFRRANHRAMQGLRLRAIGCNIDAVNLEDVKWHREWGRIVLQDELDLVVWSVPLPKDDARSPAKQSRFSLFRSSSRKTYLAHVARQARFGSFQPTSPDVHELVVAAYNRLLRNFDARLSHDDAEDAFCGAMEVKRIDPTALPFSTLLGQLYRKAPILGSLCRSFTLLSLYKYVSRYGSSYQRAIAVLLILLSVFAISYSVVGDLRLAEKAFSMNNIAMGILAALEVASFQRESIVIAQSMAGRSLRIAESIIIPAQLAITLLAVRRRFRR